MAVTRTGRRIILVDRTETVEERRLLIEVLTGASVPADRFSSLAEPSGNNSDGAPPNSPEF